MKDEWGDGGDRHLRVTPSPSHAVTVSSQVGWNAPLISCHGARWQMEVIAMMATSGYVERLARGGGGSEDVGRCCARGRGAAVDVSGLVRGRVRKRQLP